MIWELASDARCTSNAATCAGCTHCDVSALGSAARFAGVSMMPGSTEFAEIPRSLFSSATQMALAALWLLIAAAALGLFTSGAPAVSIWRRLGRGFGAALAIWGAALLVGLAAGATDPGPLATS